MKTGLLVSSLSRQAGGLYDATRMLAHALREGHACEIEVFGLEDGDTEQDAGGWAGLKVDAFPVAGPYSLGYAPGLAGGLRAAGLDLLHTHGLWMYPSHASLHWALADDKPYIISPHGMLDPWALSNSAWKKRLAGWLYENANLRGAACLHALCEAERKAIRAYGLNNPVCVIPNGIELPVTGTYDPPPWRACLPGDGRVLLYLGRLHPKKGLNNLLHAWQLAGQGRAGEAPWTLVIAGWDQGGHEAELKFAAHRLGIESSVVFAGPQFDTAKHRSYAHADAFVLPSHSEGLPMVVLEAWAHRLPVVMTPHCNLPQGLDAGAAVRIEPTASSISAGLQRLFAMPERERVDMGRQGRTLAETEFSWSRVAAQMHKVYEWVLGRGHRPSCVTFD